MAETGKTANMLSALRKRAAAVLPRFSPKSETLAPKEGAPLFQSFDPTTALFPGDADDERAGSLPLSTVLEDAAHAMARRKIELSAQARELAMRIGQRREGEMTLAAQAVRVLIGLGWAGIAAWLYWGVLNARADGISVIAGGVPLDDASVLMRTFMIVAAAALGVAFAVAALTRGLGNADNAHIAKEAERLGGAIADASGEFDKTLSSLRKSMDAHNHPADAIDELARAHVTALEAHDYFREINFLNDAEDEHARRRFKGFLARASGGANGGGMADYLITFATGVLAGALVMHYAFAPEPEPVSDLKSVVAVTSSPWAMQIIILGGLLYAAAGALLSLVAGPMTEGVAEKARAEALTALRSGFAARSALRPADVTRRIKDAVDVFRARVRGGAGGNIGRTQSAADGLGANQSSDFSGEGAVPEWRRRDSSVKFVDTGFSPAPESWRTDAYAKKFEAPGQGKTGSKRDGEVLKNRSRD